ncbi:MAG: PAN domain-containing protein, partial [Albidovulum sp.]
MRISGLFMIALLISAQVASIAPADSQETSYIPDRRLVLTENADLPGGDIQSIFDTTLEACETSCLANGQCRAITFNTKANSCFLKSGTGDQQPYVGAYSGFVLAGDNAVLSTAAARAAELGFLGPVDFDAALTQARRLGRDHLTNNWTADDLLSAAASARNAGDLRAALRYQGAALNLTDAADQWVEYAQLLSDLSQNTTGNREEMRGRALSASVNGYLRANRPALQASALLVMARALQDSDRGRDMIPALRLAQSIQPRDDAAALLDDAIAKYGFRIAEHRVDSDAARPRICATFNSRLIASGTDYAPFVQLPETGLSVEASDRQICIDGVTHGKRYAVTFRQGLPAADGEVLAKDTTLQLYIRDRAASISFPGRAYILPRAAQSGIPVQTVNTAKLDLTLQRISDRNLVRAMVEDYLARPLDYYTAEYFNRQFAEEVWRGAADMANAEPNRDVTTRLPLDAVL